MAHLENVVAESACDLPKAWVEILLIYGLQSGHAFIGSRGQEHEALACGEVVADTLSREVVVHGLLPLTCKKLGNQHVTMIKINNIRHLQKVLNKTMFKKNRQ